MPANYVLLEKITVGAAGASSVTFNSIPQTGYTDLLIKVSGRSARAGQQADNLFVTFNANTSGYTTRSLLGNGSSASSSSNASRYASFAVDAAASTASTFSNHEIYIPNYAGSTNKSYTVDSASETNATNAQSDLFAGLWSNTAAITSIGLQPEVSTWVQGTTFYLYGVAKLGTTPVIQAKATGGDIIETDGTYWYHAFLSSGTFTPTVSLSCDVLVVAGGGGGGAQGGGGAGGVLNYSAQAFSTAKTITIGAGGAGYATPSNGSASSVTGLTSPVGGGRGGNAPTGFGAVGGSGGGGWGNSTYQAGAAGTSGQGNAGGNGAVDGFIYGGVGGGGGGAGGVGGNAVPDGAQNSGGAGGAGTNTYSTWLNTTGTGVSGFIAGGGGGFGNGAPGSGGGGGGAGTTYTGNGQTGTANTGGGGGAFGGGANNGGGSGLVIVRYLV